MRWGELVALAVIVVAVVARGWPRRRADRWRVTVELERDRSDGGDANRDPNRDRNEEPPGTS